MTSMVFDLVFVFIRCSFVTDMSDREGSLSVHLLYCVPWLHLRSPDTDYVDSFSEVNM